MNIMIEQKYQNVTAETVFELMCGFDVCIMNFIKLVSVPALARHFKTSKYRIRKYMEELRGKGLVESGIESFYSDWTCQQVIVRGFYVTKEAHKTDAYKKAQEEESRLIDEIFGAEEGATK